MKLFKKILLVSILAVSIFSVVSVKVVDAQRDPGAVQEAKEQLQESQQQNPVTPSPTTTTPTAKPKATTTQAQDTNSQVCPPGSTTCSLPNPLGKGVVDPRVWVGVILRGLFGVVGSIALVLFIWGGFTIMIARGNMSEVKKGRDTMVWAAVGLGVMFGSYVIVNFIISTLLNIPASGQ